MDLRDIPRQVMLMQRQRQRDRIEGAPPPGSNPETDPTTADPSGLGKLNLVTKDYPIGNGNGPEIEKWASAPSLSRAMASIYDNDTYQRTGRLLQKAPYRTPFYAPWTGNAPAIPLLNRSMFDIGRSLRGIVNNTGLPAWTTQNHLTQMGAGAAAGGVLGTGLEHLHNMAGADPESSRNYGLMGALLGAAFGAVRKPSAPLQTPPQTGNVQS